MNKAKFLYTLSLELLKNGVSNPEKHVLYYNEIIDDYIENGFTEDFAIQQINDIPTIVTEILAIHPINTPLQNTGTIFFITIPSILLSMVLFFFSILFFINISELFLLNKYSAFFFLGMGILCLGLTGIMTSLGIYSSKHRILENLLISFSVMFKQQFIGANYEKPTK